MAKTPSPASPGGGDVDPSMDDILASIRRILDDDQAAKEPEADVLMLDPSMMVEEGGAKAAAATPETHEAVSQETQPEAATPPLLVPEAEQEHTDIVIDDFPASTPVGRDSPAPPAMAPLVAPEAAAAAANSVGALMRTLASERSSAVSRGGVTIEDIVREEIRPLLKAWLDTHLPSMVERLVRMEIERVVGRQTG